MSYGFVVERNGIRIQGIISEDLINLFRGARRVNRIRISYLIDNIIGEKEVGSSF